jgi:hypothetical protein
MTAQFRIVAQGQIGGTCSRREGCRGDDSRKWQGSRRRHVLADQELGVVPKPQLTGFWAIVPAADDAAAVKLMRGSAGQ